MASYRFGRCRLDLDARELSVDGAVVRVEPQVLDVLGYLVVHRTRLVAKTELLDQVWGSRFVSESALSSRIKSARSLIGDDGATQSLIHTERGRGYRFVGSVDVIDPPAGAQTSWRPTSTVPAVRGPLVGRVDDLATVGRLLDRHRVVTISGPGGAGKTTLALELAQDRRTEPGREITFAELAPVGNRADLARAVAEVTGVEGPGAGDITMLAASLAPRALLIVLDNCEHLLDACAELVNALLDADPATQVLATSREPLGVDGEAVHVLGSLGSEATTLFTSRATAVAGAGIVDADDPEVAELCARLDGLPLAIELAAAQLRHLTVAELNRRLDDRLGILVGGRSRAGARHATLSSTIEWSFQLLTSESREVFEQLGAFPASFDLSAVQAVAEIDRITATNRIGDLVAKSLVVFDRASGRYRLLETIRLFATSRLDSSGRRAETTERLCRHVVARTTATRRPQAWLSASLAADNRDDLENVRAAFAASIAAGRPDDAVDLMVGLSSLWRNAASYAEGLRWAAAVGSLDLAPSDRLWLHVVEADLGLGSGDPTLMARAAAAARELSRVVDDRPAAVIAGIYRSLAAISDPNQAAAGLAAARDEAAAIAEPGLHRLAQSFRAVALLAAGRRDEQEAELQTLDPPEPDGYDRYIWVWAHWATALVDRDGRRLRSWMDRQLDDVRRTGLHENWLSMFCLALTRIGEGEGHAPYLGQARRRARAEGRRADVDCVFALAYAAACRDEPVAAAELIGTSDGGLFHDTANFVHHRLIRDRVVRPLLDAPTFDAAVSRGRARPVADVLAEHGL